MAPLDDEERRAPALASARSPASDSPSDDDDDDDDDDEAAALRLHELHAQVTASNSYDAHVNKGMPQVELELRLLEAFAIYRPSMIVGMHRHFILFGLMDHLERRLNQRFSPDEVLQLLDRFFDLELLKPDDEEVKLVNHEEDFSLPPSIFEDIKKRTSV